MAEEAKFDPGLSRIMVVALTMAFSVLIGSLEALRVSPAGFTFAITWRTFLALALGIAVVGPCFYTLVYAGPKFTRRIAVVVIVCIGITGFFYPLRFVPREKMGQILGGLAMAFCALGIVAGFIYLLHRFLLYDENNPNR